MAYEKSLQQRMEEIGDPVEMLRNSQTGPYVFPIPPEFSNWRDEQESWRKTAVLFDQSFHMPDLYVEGPDTVRLLSDLGVNTFKNFRRNIAKQFIAVNYDGYVIGDASLRTTRSTLLVGLLPAIGSNFMLEGASMTSKSSATRGASSIPSHAKHIASRCKARTHGRFSKR